MIFCRKLTKNSGIYDAFTIFSKHKNHSIRYGGNDNVMFHDIHHSKSDNNTIGLEYLHSKYFVSYSTKKEQRVFNFVKVQNLNRPYEYYV